MPLIPYATLSHGEADDVADLLDDIDEPAALRSALINALRKIARLERQVLNLSKCLEE